MGAVVQVGLTLKALDHHHDSREVSEGGPAFATVPRWTPGRHTFDLQP
jgi:hypothetical protein